RLWVPSTPQHQGQCSGNIQLLTRPRSKGNLERRTEKEQNPNMMFRAAVLEMKDPEQVIWDMGTLYRMEFNPRQQPQLNEKAPKDKH
ncbi:hypothetical protein U0070_013809, partial [Myodes glareolus]